jgi:uncharacterized protein YggT (Ycf19 family)
MAALDFILNCACLLLWLNWRSKRLANLPAVPGIALVGTLKRADRRPVERWPSSFVLLMVLFVRALLYWQVGPAAHWTPNIRLGPIVLYFRSDMFSRMLIFSLLGFLFFLAAFYFSLLLLAALNRSAPQSNPWHALVRAHLGALARLPGWLMPLLPFIFTCVFWIALGPLFGTLKLVVPAKSFTQLMGQAVVIALGAWLLWQYIIAVVLVLHIASSYVYFGNAPFWNFINLTARNLLRPLAIVPLCIGKLDLTPVLAMLLLVAAVIFAPRGLAWVYSNIAM